MKTNEEKTIEVLRKFFIVSTSAFEMQHKIAEAFGNFTSKSDMYYLHLLAKNELGKENPNIEKIDELLELMELEAEKTKTRNDEN